MITATPGYRVEGTQSIDEVRPYSVTNQDDVDEGTLKHGVFDLRDNDFQHYRQNFIVNNSNHETYLAVSSPAGPCAASFYRDASVLPPRFVGLLVTPASSERCQCAASTVSSAWWRRTLSLPPSGAEIIAALSPKGPLPKFKHITDPKLPQALLKFEEKQLIRGFKFGVLYAAVGQTKEDEMFANSAGSEQFNEFLSFLGDHVRLKDFDRFRGGLDVKSHSTGEESLFTTWNNNEIMFHVSTLLPFNKSDKQQLERKRHIGNDLVVVVFMESENESYRPTTISSRQVHVVFVVQRVRVPDDLDTVYYRLSVVSKDVVPAFGPPIPSDLIFEANSKFRTLFFSKLLNAEHASYRAPVLDTKLQRTRRALLDDITNAFT